MPITISGTSGITYPAGGTANTAGSGVGTTDTQTLTNKTLTSPTITGASMSSMASSVITSGTAQNSTSGTSIDFTGIPSWVKRITVMFNNVSTNGSSDPMIQLGTSGGFLTTGYTSAAMRISAGAQYTTGFGLPGGAYVSTNVSSGIAVIALLTGNTWAQSGTFISGSNTGASSAGSVTLSGTLDRVRITTVNGTDTFDAGSINILYE